MLTETTGAQASAQPSPTADRYAYTIIRRYDSWSLRLNTNQTNLGRAVVWLNRTGRMRSVLQLGPKEEREFRKVILPKYEEVMDQLFHPDKYNYLWAGNLEEEHGGHGHWHLVPRYEHPASYGGLMFPDPTYGDMYSREKRELPRDAFLQLRDYIAVHL